MTAVAGYEVPVTIRPSDVSTRNIRPGRSRPFAITSAAGMSSTPDSDAITTRPSLVAQ